MAARRRGRCFYSDAPIHDRQMVTLAREDWQAWLYLNKPEKELLQLLAAGAYVRG
jgi:putative SOS response-associated peptidase YedK